MIQDLRFIKIHFQDAQEQKRQTEKKHTHTENAGQSNKNERFYLTKTNKKTQKNVYGFCFG